MSKSSGFRGLLSQLKQRWSSRLTSSSLGDASPAAGGSIHHRAKRETVESLFAYLEGETDQPAWPMELFLEVSNLCDLKCAMCPTFSPLNDKRFENLKAEQRGLMDLERLEPCIKELVEHALVVHAFGYGEPTVHPKFKEFLTFLSEHEVWIDFFTNGMHLDEAFCRFMVEKKIARITISFSGSSKEEYENVYIEGDYQRVLGNLAGLKRIKEEMGSPFPQVHVNSIAFEHHVQRLPEFVDLMADHGVEAIHLKPLTTHDAIPQLHGHISVYREDVEKPILEQAKRIAKQRGIHLASAPYERSLVTQDTDLAIARAERHKGNEPLSTKTVPVSELKSLSQQIDHIAKEERLKNKPQAKRRNRRLLDLEGKTLSIGPDKPPCLEPFKTLYLMLDGSMRPCCFSAETASMGNIFEYSSAAAWSNERFGRVRSSAIEGRYYASLCGHCLKTSSYPKDMNLTMKLNQYSKLFQSRFGAPFSTHLVAQSRELGSNQDILCRMAANLSS